jgi:hypothetical protein
MMLLRLPTTTAVRLLTPWVRSSTTRLSPLLPPRDCGESQGGADGDRVSAASASGALVLAPLLASLLWALSSWTWLSKGERGCVVEN